MKKSRIWILFAILTIQVATSSCFQKFYSTNTVQQVTSAHVDSAIAEGRHFILHYRDTVFAMNAMSRQGDTLTALLAPVPEGWRVGLNPRTQSKNLMAGKDQAELLNQVHLYYNTNYLPVPGQEKVELSLAGMWRMDKYGLDKQSTNQSTAMSILGIVIPLAVIVGLVIAVGNMPISLGN